MIHCSAKNNRNNMNLEKLLNQVTCLIFLRSPRSQVRGFCYASAFGSMFSTINTKYISCSFGSKSIIVFDMNIFFVRLPRIGCFLATVIWNNNKTVSVPLQATVLSIRKSQWTAHSSWGFACTPQLWGWKWVNLKTIVITGDR